MVLLASIRDSEKWSLVLGTGEKKFQMNEDMPQLYTLDRQHGL